MRKIIASAGVMVVAIWSPLAAQTPPRVLTPVAAQAPASTDLDYRQRLEERLQGLDRQLREATGAIESLQFQLRSSDQRIEKLEAELAARMGQSTAPTVNDASVAPSPQPQEMDKTENAPGLLPVGDAQVEYDAAFGLLRRGSFEAGGQDFKAFLQHHPKHKLAGNARYWIGETLYARQRYQEAATTFLEAWQGDVRGPKAPDNLLKLSLSLSKLGKNKEACISLKKLLNDYSDAPPRITGVASRERQSMNCG